MSDMKPRVAVLLGGRSAESAVSAASGKRVLETLRGRGYPAVAIDGGAGLYERLQATPVDIVFNALHGTWGEDGRVQALLDWLNLPYTGSDLLGCAVSFDKHLTKKLLQAEGVPTARWQSLPLEGQSPAYPRELGPSLVVKPRRDGSSAGVVLVHTEQEWDAAILAAKEAHVTEVLAEEYIRGREFTVGILGADILPIVEIVPGAGHPFYTYAAKYSEGGSRHLVPAPLEPRLAERLQQFARQTHQVVGLRDYSRTDILLSASGEIAVLEINALPGLTEQSLLPDAAMAAGIGYDELIERILSFALARA